MCSESYEDKCTQCTEVEHLHSDLEFSITRAANAYHTAHHGEGCGGNNVVFYALDTVIWSDVVAQFGVNNTDREFTEALVKVDSEGEDVFVVDLSSRGLEEDDTFWTLINGDEEVNDKYLHKPAGKNERSVADTEFEDQGREYVHEISRYDLLSIEEDNSQDYLVFVYTKWCGYCHVMRRKIEAAARLLDSNLSLSFVAIDPDKNDNLRDTNLVIKSLPSVYLYLHTAFSPIKFEHESHKPASISDLVKFIKKHTSNISLQNSYNPLPPSPPSVPCSAWIPSPAPPYKPSSVDLTLAHAQTSPIDDMLDSKGDPAQQHPIEQKLDELYNEQSDNFPNTVLDNMKFEDKSPVFKNRKSLCESLLHLFKALSVGSGIHPYNLNSVTATLVRDLHDDKCFKLDLECLRRGIEYSHCFTAAVKHFWSWIEAGCTRESWERTTCKYLLVATELGSQRHIVPYQAVDLLIAKRKMAVKRYKRALFRAERLAIPVEMDDPVEEFETFYIDHCYNTRLELKFYLTQSCSYLCRVTCRVINKYHVV